MSPKQLHSTIVRLLSNMASAKEIQQYLKRFSRLDAARFAVVKVGGAVLRAMSSMRWSRRWRSCNRSA